MADFCDHSELGHLPTEPFEARLQQRKVSCTTQSIATGGIDLCWTLNITIIIISKRRCTPSLCIVEWKKCMLYGFDMSQRWDVLKSFARKYSS